MANTNSKNKVPRRPEFKTLMRRLARAGFERRFIRSALLPEWWDETSDDDPALLTDFEIRVARFLEFPLSAIRDSNVSFAPPELTRARLRRVREVDSQRLAPAIHSAGRIADATVRSLREPSSDPKVPPLDGCEWRRQIAPSGVAVTLDQILGDLWSRGIPVVPLEIIPSPSFQAIVCVKGGRPVILIGQKNDEPGRVAFWLAHEVGHIVHGDCDSDHLVLDGEDSILDETDIEVQADHYARQVLVGAKEIPEIESSDFKAIAKELAQEELSTGIDAGMIAAVWASRTGDYAMATMALKALYRASGARQRIRKYFQEHVDVAGATETDRHLLRCVYGGLDAYQAFS